MSLLHGYQQRPPAQDGAGAGADQDGCRHSDGTTDDGFQDAPIPHEMNVDTEPVTNLCAGREVPGTASAEAAILLPVTRDASSTAPFPAVEPTSPEQGVGRFNRRFHPES